MKPKRKASPTKKQITALQLLASDPTLSPRQAMLRAGYSKHVAGNPTKRLFQSDGVQAMAEIFPHELAKFGVTLNHIAKKYAEWLDAGTIIKDPNGNPLIDANGDPIKRSDYKTQIAAGQMLKDIFNLTPKNQPSADNVTRRVTLEEYLNPNLK